MLRTGYTTRVRPWKDAPGDVEIRWYKSPPGATELGVPSLFRSLHWESHPYLFANGLGEVFNEPVKVYPHKAPPFVTGLKHCGSDEDFASGGLFDTSLPPVTRDADGIMACCRPVLGGVVIDGQGAAPPGGVELDSVTGVDTTDFLSPPNGIPAFAGLRGVTYVFAAFGPTEYSPLQWFDVTPGQWYRVTLAALEAAGTWQVFWWDSGVTFGFLGGGSVSHADTFEGQAPAFGFRIIVKMHRPGFFGSTLWQAAVHPIPDPTA